MCRGLHSMVRWAIGGMPNLHEGLGVSSKKIKISCEMVQSEAN